MSGTSSIKSAGILIIGDEVLNGKILDTNSHEFAKYCFRELGIPLKRTVVCGDDEEDIISSLETLKDCEFVLTSGGIGSTHDDITYPAIAKAFNLPCELDQEVVERMQSIRESYLLTLSQQQLDAFYRMATIPKGENVEKIYVDEKLWVPIVGINKRVFILPGIPQLFTSLMLALGELIKPRIEKNEQTRLFVTTKTGESELAPFLKSLQEKYDSKLGKLVVKLGSYPHYLWKINTISIIGDSSVGSELLNKIVKEVIEGIGGDAKLITGEEEDRLTTTDPEK